VKRTVWPFTCTSELPPKRTSYSFKFIKVALP
jgi:hypothetical protein